MEKTKTEFCYYSKLLNKPFDTLKELQEAEAEFHKANEEKEKLASEKKARAEEIKLLKSKTIEARKEAQKLIKEADDAYNKAVDEFIRDYGSYHESYYNDGKREVITINDVIDSFFKPFSLL